MSKKTLADDARLVARMTPEMMEFAQKKRLSRKFLRDAVSEKTNDEELWTLLKDEAAGQAEISAAHKKEI
jgi:hypothetical protein